MNDVKITVEVDRESELTFYRFESPTYMYETCLSDGQQAALEKHFRARFAAERVPEDWSNGESFILHERVPEDVQALVEEAREWAPLAMTPEAQASLIRRLAAAVIGVSSGRDALAAVIEEARTQIFDLATRASGSSVPFVTEVRDTLDAIHDDVLSRTPSDALVEHDAKVRAEVIDWIEGGDLTPSIKRSVRNAREHFGLTKGVERG